jgi:hypothetical protein
MDEQRGEAAKELQKALRLCHPQSHRNRRVILSYLVPVRMLEGVLPRRAALQRYALQYLEPIVDAVKAGNVVQLTAALAQEEGRFMRVCIMENSLEVCAHKENNFSLNFELIGILFSARARSHDATSRNSHADTCSNEIIEFAKLDQF